MRRHKALRSLSQEHHHGLMLAQLIKAGSPVYKGLPTTIIDKKLYTIKFFEEKLIPHFKKEEEVLFPLTINKNAVLKKLIIDLIDQHKEIYSLMNNLKNSSEPEIVLDELGKSLENHIRIEERELFQMVQEVLSEEELLRLESDIGNTSIECEI